jgi:tRNA G18 (ribose-2'-O)-methylase SpoU
MDVFLYAPAQFANLCLIARTLEVFGFRECHVFDPHRLVRERYGKSYTQRLRTVSAGAFSKIRWQRLESDPIAFLDAQRGRRVATVASPSASSLYEFRFRTSDWLIFGPEARGLDSAFLQSCQAHVTVPQSGVTESLNLAVAAGIVLSECRRQTSLNLLESVGSA